MTNSLNDKNKILKIKMKPSEQNNSFTLDGRLHLEVDRHGFVDPIQTRYLKCSYEDIFHLIPYRMLTTNTDGLTEIVIKTKHEARLSEKRNTFFYAYNILSNHEISRWLEYDLTTDRPKKQYDLTDKKAFNTNFFRQKRILHVSLVVLFCLLATEKELDAVNPILSKKKSIIKAQNKIVDNITKENFHLYLKNDFYLQLKELYFFLIESNFYEPVQMTNDKTKKNHMDRVKNNLGIHSDILESYISESKKIPLLISDAKKDFENQILQEEKNIIEISETIFNYMSEYKYDVPERMLNVSLAYIDSEDDILSKDRPLKAYEQIGFQFSSSFKTIYDVLTDYEGVHRRVFAKKSGFSGIDTFEKGLYYYVVKQQSELYLEQFEQRIMKLLNLKEKKDLIKLSKDYDLSSTESGSTQTSRLNVKKFSKEHQLDSKKVKSVIKQMEYFIDRDVEFDNFYESYMTNGRKELSLITDEEKIKDLVNNKISEQLKSINFVKSKACKDLSIKDLVEIRSEKLREDEEIIKQFSLRKSQFDQYNDLLKLASTRMNELLYTENFCRQVDFFGYIFDVQTMNKIFEEVASPFTLYFLDNTLEQGLDKKKAKSNSKQAIESFVKSIFENPVGRFAALISPDKFLDILVKINKVHDRKALAYTSSIADRVDEAIMELKSKYPGDPKVKKIINQIEANRKPFIENTEPIISFKNQSIKIKNVRRYKICRPDQLNMETKHLRLINKELKQ